jgi:ribosome maturation factor RimP
LTVTVPFQMSTSVDQLITQLTAELSAIETQEEASRSFLVVLLYGGSDGVSLDQGRRLAERAQLLLGESWDRVVQGRTYYVPAVNYRQPYGSLQLKLFPVAGLK